MINQSKCSIAGPIFSKSWIPDQALYRMITHLCPFELKIKTADAGEMAYTSKQRKKLTRYVILFVLKDKTESIFYQP